ncbi:ATP-binding protein [Paenibacillus sp. Leaf72]|uniref:ATP-binding protein n=1 Tax=Paenibacillus sp. Leaf72 TaxID=1736234 RepID=UPI0006FAE7E6|nr:ATP-binding protein [Paenibacillus sp. Leaf72]KQO17259.1 cell division protein [Paenibacillus sp. Leaf72]
MNKIDWLRQMASERPEDPQTHYWLGMEYAAGGQYVEAIGAYSAGLSCCTGQEELRAQLLQELTHASMRLQGGAVALAAAASEAKSEQNQNSASGWTDKSDSIVASDDEEEFEEDGQDGENDEDRGIAEQPGADGRSFLTKGHIGLKVIDGGQVDPKQEAVSVPKITFEDVAGLTELKKSIHIRIISPFYNQGLFSKFRKKIGGGVLLYGPPGCGKTYIARATAGECRASFIPVHITDILDPYIGVSERNLKDMFDKARSQKPSIMFFDEIDTLGYNRSKSSSSSMRGVIDTFLTEMEGIDTNTDQVLILGATNLPWDVDGALKRPGRFDRMVFVAPPDVEARKRTFEMKLHGRYVKQMDIAKLAASTEFYSGADIDNVVERATEIVLEHILETGVERPIGIKDMEQALGEIRPTTLEWLRTAKNYVKYSNQSGIYNEVEHYLRQFGRLI